MKKFKIIECDCEICSYMCMAPCCGTPKEMKAIIDAGYGDRLCLDDWEGENPDLHPALKGYESKRAPYEVSSEKGCTFWINGKCELHDKGLKPLLGKVAHHDPSNKTIYDKACEFVKESWETEEAKDLIKDWKNNGRQTIARSH